jgi:1-acyl-sn-glycerol-3-phosphate acyltransferase
MKIFKAIYTYYGFTIFALLFFLLLPLLLIPMLFPSKFEITGIINRWWAKLLFTFIFIPYKVECRVPLDKKKQYVFCANHFSYLDIPTMGLTPINAIFVGKSEIENVPLFGFMYRRLHITVNRSSLRSRMTTILESIKALEEGKSLLIFPEGGIVTKHPPHMVPFKDGAFRAAIEKQIPLVPVSIPFNWIILPDKEPIRLNRGLVKIIFHEPISTKGLTLESVEELKLKVYNIINHELQISLVKRKN